MFTEVDWMLAMSRKFPRVNVIRVRRESFRKQKCYSKRTTTKDNLTRQSNLNSAHFSNVSASRSISLSHTTNTIIKSQQKNIHHERRQEQISSVGDGQDENSTGSIGQSDSHLWLNRTCRIKPSNSRELFNDDFKINFDGR